MGIIDSILKTAQEEDPNQIPNRAPVAGQPNQSNWVQDLIGKRYQPQVERIKRKPIGFNFQREPFDPSSYYRALGTFKDISRLATNVTLQEVQNRQEAEAQKAWEQSQNALKGVNPNFDYGNVTPYNGASRHYKLRGVSPITGQAADYFGSRYGIRTIYGLGKGSVPGSDHPKGRAVDFMINNIKNGHNVGTTLANDVIRNYKRWNVKYVIWNRYIWSPGRGWRRYNGPSPHTDHVHVSFNR